MIIVGTIIGFEQTMISVLEDVGSVSLCVRVLRLPSSSQNVNTLYGIVVTTNQGPLINGKNIDAINCFL